MSAAIVVKNLIKTYPGKPPVEAVRGIDLEIQRGECFGLLGPNGAGKTTTLEILEGLLPATSGTVEIFGLNWREHEAEIRRRLGISLQETRFSDKLTVLETVRLFRSFYRVGLSPWQAIERVSLTEKVHSFVEKLSGGQKQRLAVACALVGDPELLFLDEPTTGLDPQSRRQLWEVIRTLNDHGRTVVITTHYMDEAERLCDRVAVIDHGRIIALGSPGELIARLGGEHMVEAALQGSPPADVADQLSRLPAVQSVHAEGTTFRLSTAEPHVLLPRLLDHLRDSGIELAGMTTRHATLEDVFVALTGRHLRDETAA